MSDLNMYREITDEERARAKEAHGFMVLALFGLVVCFISEVMFFVAVIGKRDNWWVFFLVSIIAFIISDLAHTTAKRICPEMFRKDY